MKKHSILHYLTVCLISLSLSLSGSPVKTVSLLARHTLNPEGSLLCPEPQSLSTSGITSSSAILDWSKAGTESSWTLRYGPPGFDPMTGGNEISGIINHPYTLNPPLLPGTTYDWYVRADCGGGVLSSWSVVNSFTTLCPGGSTAPFFDNFEAGYAVAEPITGCWTQEISSGNYFICSNGNFFPAYSGTLNAFLYWGSNTWMFRKITLSGGQAYDVSCWGRLDPAYGVPGDGTVEIRYGTSGTSAAMTNVIISPTILLTPGYMKLTGSFTPAVSGDYYIGIHGIVNYRPWGIAIDDISVTPVACPTAAMLTATGITHSSAVLGWSSSTSTLFDIELGVVGFTPTGIPTHAGVTNPYTVTGLSEYTTYSYYVRAHCAGSSYSSWSAPFTFSTYCNPAPSLPFSEGFENAFALNQPIGDCWSQEIVNGYNLFQCHNGPYITARTGTQSAFLYFNGDTWLMRNFNLTGGVQYSVSCWARQDGLAGSYGDGSLAISYGTAATNAAMTQVIVPATILPTTGYMNVNGSFTPPVSGVYFIGFHGVVNGFPWGIAIDDIKVDVTPVVPVTLTVNSEVLSSPKCYNATQTILVAGSGNQFTVVPGGDATFIAGQNIRFLPGSKVNSGGNLHGYIDPGGPWCTFGEALVTSAEEVLPAMNNDARLHFRIYPNPTGGDFTVEANPVPASGSVTLEIYHSSGSCVLNETVPLKSKTELTLAGRPAGLYIVRIVTGDRSETLKLVKTD